jgi:hypothetical protein
MIEVGSASMTDDVMTIQFKNTYINPVVIGGVPTHSGGHAAVVRLKDVRADAFDIYLDEPSCLDKKHVPEVVSYLVVEAGWWGSLQIGLVNIPPNIHGENGGTEVWEHDSCYGMADVCGLHAGVSHGCRWRTMHDGGPSPRCVCTIDDQPCTPQGSSTISAEEWHTVRHLGPIEGDTVVFSQVQTHEIDDEIDDESDEILKTRQRNLASDTWQLALEGGSQYTQTVGWLAMAAGTGFAGELLYEAILTDAIVTHEPHDLLLFASDFQANPGIFGSITSFNGIDPSHLRQHEIVTREGARIFIEEESCAGTHEGSDESDIAERVAIIAIEMTAGLTPDPVLCSALLTPQRLLGTANEVVLEVGTLYMDNNVATVEFKNTYANPVIFGGMPTHTEEHEAAVRIKNIRADGFDIYLDEPTCLDQTHVPEAVSYLVVDAGWWGSLQIGLVETTSTDLGSWHHVDYLGPIEGDPVVFSQVQTHKGSNYVKTRQRNVGPCGLELALEEDASDAGDDFHHIETIGWLAMAAGTGLAGELLYEAILTDAIVTHEPHDLLFVSDFQATPGIFGSITSFIGIDPSPLRQHEIVTREGARIFIEEESCAGTDRAHAAERVAILAIEMTAGLTPIPADTPTKKAALVGYWPFDSDAIDLSGNGLHGSITEFHAADFIAGIINNAISMEDNAVLVADHGDTALDVSEVLMMSWIMPRDQHVWAQTHSVVMSKNGVYEFGLSDGSLTDTNVLQGAFNGGCWRWWGTQTLNENVWTHVAVGVDGTSQHHFVNGQLAEQDLCSGSLFTNDESFKIGAGSDGDGQDDNFFGVVDEAMLFDRCLNADEVANIYDSSLPIKASFELINDQKRFWDAEEYCIQRDGHLASVHSEKDTIALMSLGAIGGAWIGMHDNHNEAVCDGSAFVWTDDQSTGYTNWASGEPNDWQNGKAQCDGLATIGEDCTHLYADGFWNDFDCNSRRPFVCGYDIRANIPLAMSYVVVATAASFSDANEHCTGIGGHLASIRSESQNNAVMAMRPGDAWIGFHDMQTESFCSDDTFMWIDGLSKVYTKWAANEPNNVHQGAAICAPVEVEGSDEIAQSSDCVVVTVGSSQANSKSVSVDSGYRCPSAASRYDWVNNDSYDDIFDLSQMTTQLGSNGYGDVLTATRTDSVVGWGQQLQIRCCRDTNDLDGYTLISNIGGCGGDGTGWLNDPIRSVEQCAARCLSFRYFTVASGDSNCKCGNGCIASSDGHRSFRYTGAFPCLAAIARV